MTEKKRSLVAAVATDNVRKGIEDLLSQVSGGLEEKILNQVKTELQSTLHKFVNDEIETAKKGRKVLEDYIKDLEGRVTVITHRCVESSLKGIIDNAIRGVWTTYIQKEVENAFASRQSAFVLEIAKQVKQVL